jgi:predicted aspartyl protease
MKLGLFVLLTLPLPAADFMFADVSINGAGPFKLLVDTGASSTSLSREAARLAGLQAAYAVQLTTLTGETIVPAALAKAVSTGGAALQGVEVLIADPLAIRTVEPKADGVLGQSFLSRIPWMIDYRNRRFVTGETAVLLSRAIPEFACERADDSRLVLPLTIGKATFRVALDSGASALVLHCGSGCPRLEDPDPSRQILTTTGSARATFGRLRDIAAGPVALKRANAVLIEKPPLAPSIHGVLPATWFGSVFVDPQSATMRLAK